CRAAPDERQGRCRPDDRVVLRSGNAMDLQIFWAPGAGVYEHHVELGGACQDFMDVEQPFGTHDRNEMIEVRDFPEPPAVQEHFSGKLIGVRFKTVPYLSREKIRSVQKAGGHRIDRVE